MDTIELWEQELENEITNEEALKEERIYNFYGDTEPVSEGFFSNLKRKHELHKATWELAASIQSALASALYRYGADVSLYPWYNNDFINGTSAEYTMRVDMNHQYRQRDYGTLVKAAGMLSSDPEDATDYSMNSADWERMRKYKTYKTDMKQRASMDVSIVLREFNKEILNDVMEDTGVPIIKITVAKAVGGRSCVVVTLAKPSGELVTA